jgi:hypothetical protein
VNQLALFLFDDAFSLADVDKSLNVVAVVVFFLFCIGLFQLFLFALSIDRSVRWFGG